jgi:hypothetical protein
MTSNTTTASINHAELGLEADHGLSFVQAVVLSAVIVRAGGYPTPTRDIVEEVVEGTTYGVFKPFAAYAERFGESVPRKKLNDRVRSTLKTLVKNGFVETDGEGRWAIAEDWDEIGRLDEARDGFGFKSGLADSASAELVDDGNGSVEATPPAAIRRTRSKPVEGTGTWRDGQSPVRVAQIEAWIKETLPYIPQDLNVVMDDSFLELLGSMWIEGGKGYNGWKLVKDLRDRFAPVNA